VDQISYIQVCTVTGDIGWCVELGNSADESRGCGGRPVSASTAPAATGERQYGDCSEPDTEFGDFAQIALNVHAAPFNKMLVQLAEQPVKFFKNHATIMGCIGEVK
jgi:hypothetical protein